MENLKRLECFIRNHGWYSGKLKLEISLVGEFEGFYGKASEDWEHQVKISIHGGKLPDIEIVGGRHDNIDKVAEKVYQKLHSLIDDAKTL